MWNTVLIVIFLQLDVVEPKEKKRTPPTTLTYEQYLAKREAKFKIKYNPNYGYEPYWADGEFVLTTTTQDPSVSTTKKPTICGEECNYLLRRIKEVCAHKSDYIYRGVCVYWKKCVAKPGDDLNPGFKTFPTYCAFLDAQCRNGYWTGRYVLIHVGKCMKIDDVFKPVWTGWQPINRIKIYLTSYMRSFYPEMFTTSTTKTKKQGRKFFGHKWPTSIFSGFNLRSKIFNETTLISAAPMSPNRRRRRIRTSKTSGRNGSNFLLHF